MRSSRPLLWTVILATLLGIGPLPAHAHKASDAFLDLRRDGEVIAVRWDIALRDLDQVLDLDLDSNGTLEWSEIEARQEAIRGYAFESIGLSTKAGSCRRTAVSQQLARREDGTYAVIRWRSECPRLDADIDIDYRLLADIDPTHRAIVSVSGAEVELRTLRPSMQTQTVSLRARESGSENHDLGGFFIEGFRHILHGFDHLAFLLALLIPAIMLAGITRQRLAVTLGELLAIVSVFTLAHSVTLGLTAFNLISLPSRLVETLIALSVIFAGAQAFLVGRPSAIGAGTAAAVRESLRQAGRASLRPAVVPLWLVFAFGLVHGMGFGSALGDSGFGGRSALRALLGFNLGVEAGQLAVVALVFPLAWSLRSTVGFTRVFLPGSALAVVVAGLLWFVARAFDVDIAPGFLAG